MLHNIIWLAISMSHDETLSFDDYNKHHDMQKFILWHGPLLFKFLSLFYCACFAIASRITWRNELSNERLQICKWLPRATVSNPGPGEPLLVHRSVRTGESTEICRTGSLQDHSYLK